MRESSGTPSRTQSTPIRNPFLFGRSDFVNFPEIDKMFVRASFEKCSGAFQTPKPKSAVLGFTPLFNSSPDDLNSLKNPEIDYLDTDFDVHQIRWDLVAISECARTTEECAYEARDQAECDGFFATSGGHSPHVACSRPPALFSGLVNAREIYARAFAHVVRELFEFTRHAK
eukprot:23059_1